jgi:hypothetical protein
VRIFKDFAKVQRVLRGMVDTRTSRRAVAQRLRGMERPAAGEIKIAVYFADDAVNLYQMRQWYAPLAELSKRWPVAIIARSPTSTLALWDEAPVPTLYLRSVASLEEFVAQQDLRIVFYVNQNSKNFQMFRYGRMWHVFINHGESDKMYMTTNQFKAYDYSLIAGDAARDRLGRTLWNYDLDARTMSIGRPQADHFAGELPFTPDERTTVLYAPTWEGDRPAAAYGSVVTHGVALVDALLATGTHRVIYRPHPRSGVIEPAYARANQHIIAAIARANAEDPAAQHIYDDGNTLGWQLASADVAITDISAMVYDRLATGRPIVVTRPENPLAEIDSSGYLGDAEWLSAADAPDIAAIAERVQHSTEALDKLNWWVARYFGDTTEGRATERFHAAVETLMAEWETAANARPPAEPSGVFLPPVAGDVTKD